MQNSYGSFTFPLFYHHNLLSCSIQASTCTVLFILHIEGNATAEWGVGRGPGVKKLKKPLENFKGKIGIGVG
jgi:hypothetical protein